MKILFLASWYPTERNPNFGIFIKEHAHAIHAAGNEIIVLALVISKDKHFLKYTEKDVIDENGVRTILLEIKSRYSDYLNHIFLLQNYLIRKIYNKKIKNNFQPEIIHSNVVFPAGILGCKLSNVLKRPHVITEHWSRINGLLQKPYFGKIAIKTYQRADAILPVSEFLKMNIHGLIPTLNSVKIIPVPNVIDTNTFCYSTKELSNEVIRFCAVATWANKKIPDKMPELFIEALGKIQSENSRKIQLTMIGGGDKIPKLKELCLINQIDATFTGYLCKTEISKHLQAAHFFVHASTIETFGVVVAEALMCGTPVICSNVGALPELINNNNGVLCENNPESWFDAISLAINKNFDLKSISNGILNNFSPIAVGAKITEVYNSL